MKKWTIGQKIAFWMHSYGMSNLWQRVIIPYHIVLGIWYKYKPKDIYEFCVCCWSGTDYPFDQKRPDLARSR